jgi:hypothetical protein
MRVLFFASFSLSRLAGQNGESVSFRFGPFKSCPGISFSFSAFRHNRHSALNASEALGALIQT